ncbi:hypothetical protein VTL71DRAFT_10270 [Oculimacula yallundae]|uniref:Uncharacterized protein n=1 Tax=Oculimacula yallundae TaxID=86028 RepID=A0ABR4CUU8_9HELO
MKIYRRKLEREEMICMSDDEVNGFTVMNKRSLEFWWFLQHVWKETIIQTCPKSCSCPELHLLDIYEVRR